MATQVQSDTNGRHGNGSTVTPSARRTARDIRKLLPVLGLREYWYPALFDKDVGWKKPVLVQMLGEDLCLFRGASGKVVAFDNACPHRGAKLSSGHCDFKGTLACFYHGMVFDETGLCLAAFGEGPESPMPGKLRARTYPTETLKGVVFVWMGSGAPVPIEEDVPEEFFEPGTMVLHWTSAPWEANWRPAVENYADSHVRYVHRDSVLMLMRPVMPPALMMKGRPKRIGPHRLAGPGRDGELQERRRRSGEYQHFYPLLAAKWPQHRWRLLWTWIFTLADRVRWSWRKRFKSSDDWGMGQHLPSIVRINYGTHMYTRWAVPVDAGHTRMFYFHAARRPTWIGRLQELVWWHLFHNWAMNQNFSEQDSPGAIELYYDRPERLTITDVQTIEWRKLVLAARGMEGHRQEEDGEIESEVKAERSEVEVDG